MGHTVSVVVPTRNRPASLESTLKSLLKHCTGSYDELLIVDSTDPHLNAEVMRIANTLKCTYIREGKTGLSTARNTAIRSATGQIVVFVDDDFLFRSDSIRQLVLNFRDPEVAACTGRMVALRRDEAAKLFESVFSYDRGLGGFDVSRSDMRILDLARSFGALGKTRLGDRTPLPFRVGYGFCSFRREAFSNVGYFDENLGRGSVAEGGEDVDMFYRILRHGFKIRYDPKAMICHRHRLARHDMISYAWAAGHSVRAVTHKYWSTDPYMLFIYLGALVYFTIGALPFRGGAQLHDLFRHELRGLMGSSRPRSVNSHGSSEAPKSEHESEEDCQ